MKNYVVINDGQSYDTIGANIVRQLEASPSHHLRFVRIPDTNYMYKAYALMAGKECRPSNNSIFFDIAGTKGLEVCIKGLMHGRPLLQEIEVIEPRWGSGKYGVFIKQKKESV